MKNKKNMKLFDTRYGQLLVQKGIDEDENYSLTSTMVFELQGDIFITPKVSFCYTEREKFDKSFGEFTEELAESLAESLYKTIEDLI